MNDDKEKVLEELTKTIEESSLSRAEMSNMLAQFFLAIETFNVDIGFVSEIEFLKK